MQSSTRSLCSPETCLARSQQRELEYPHRSIKLCHGSHLDLLDRRLTVSRESFTLHLDTQSPTKSITTIGATLALLDPMVGQNPIGLNTIIPPFESIVKYNLATRIGPTKF
jgi:hypothetical protein